METTAATPSRMSRPAKFVERHADEGWTEASLRWLIFQAKQNGLEAAGAVVRQGRRVFIDEAKFYAWLRTNRAGA